MISCEKCSDIYYNVNNYIRHLRLHHYFLPDSKYLCTYPDCNRLYNTINSFRKHLTVHFKKANNDFDLNNEAILNNTLVLNDEHFNNSKLNEVSVECADLNSISNMDSVDIFENSKQIFFKFILKLLCDRSLPRNNAIQIIQNAHLTYSYFFISIKAIIDKNATAFNQIDLNELASMFDFVKNINSISEYRLFKELIDIGYYFKANDNILRIENEISYDENNAVISKRKYVTKSAPLLFIFQKLFCCTNFLHKIYDYIEF